MDTQNDTNITFHFFLFFAVLVASGIIIFSFKDTNDIGISLIHSFVVFLILLPLFAFASILIWRDLNTIATTNPTSPATKIILLFHIIFGVIGVILVFIGLASIIHDIYLHTDFITFFIHIIILFIGLKIIHINLYKKLIRRLKTDR